MPLTAEHSMNVGRTAAATITALLPTGERIVRELYEGDSVVIGSLEGCDVQLQLDEVASTHCILGVDDGTVWLRDCYSPGGTFVDDRRISQTQVHQSASIRIGSCDLSLHLHGAPAEAEDIDLQRSRWRSEIDAVGFSDQPGAAERPDPESNTPTPSGAQAPPPAPEPPTEESTDGRVDELIEQLAQAHSEIEQLQRQLERGSHEESLRLASALAPQADPVQEEMLELLRTEVTELQNELAQRDAQLAELRDGAAAAPADDAPVSQEELETLVSRLEELLEELQHKDEHVELLEEMLRASEDANRAEQEERVQLETWVRDIEQRVAEREAEWRAGTEKLQQTMEEQAEHRRRLERALEEALTADRAVAVREELTEGLRKELAETRSQLEASEQQRQHLQQQLQSRTGEDDGALREQQAEIARERAELARQRAQFESFRHHAAVPPGEQQEPSPQPDGHTHADRDASMPTPARGSDADERIRALRQHLAQTPDDEMAEEKPTTLSSRIANLWRKLESSD